MNKKAYRNRNCNTEKIMLGITEELFLFLIIVHLCNKNETFEDYFKIIA